MVREGASLWPMATNQTRPALTPNDVAHRFNVSLATVRRWANDGLVKSFRTPGGKLRFRPSDIDAIDADDIDGDESALA